jgi:hypothetical protein
MIASLQLSLLWLTNCFVLSEVSHDSHLVILDSSGGPVPPVDGGEDLYSRQGYSALWHVPQ